MVTGVTVHDIEIVDLVEVMLGGIGCIDARDTRVETTTQDSSQSCLLETVLIGPLPRVFEVCLVLWLIVSRVEIVTATSQTGVHDCQVLIGQGEVDHELRLIVVEECLQLLHIIGIYLCGLDVHLVASLMDILHNLVAFSFSAAGNHKVGKYIGILRNLECCYRCDASGANH